jgi:hypothetical protein
MRLLSVRIVCVSCGEYLGDGHACIWTILSSISHFLFADLDFRGTVAVCLIYAEMEETQIRNQICYFKGIVEFDLFVISDSGAVQF